MKNLKLFFALCACLCLLAPLCRQAQADPITGVYRLTSRVQPGMCLDVEGWGNANGTPVSLYTANHTSNQQWLVERQGDGSYKIYSYSGQNSLQMLDCANGATGNGNAVATYADNGNVAQRWYFVSVGAGWYRIVPVNAGRNSLQSLEIAGGAGAATGSRTQINAYSGGDNQVFRLDWSGPAKLLINPKKGIGGRENKTPALNCSWYYNWGSGRPGDAPTGIGFVPMVWGNWGAPIDAGWLNSITSPPNDRTVLAFNEPDGQDQANMTVQNALNAYRYLSDFGKQQNVPIGSPACVHADGQWMRDFMSGAAQRGYRVDYVTIHWYGGNDPNGFLNYVDYIHNLYNKPVWITEFCPADWSGNHGISAGDCAWFMQQVIPALNSRSYVQRYAWYTGDTPQGNGTLSTAGLVNDDGTLSDLGKLYARL